MAVCRQSTIRQEHRAVRGVEGIDIVAAVAAAVVVGDYESDDQEKAEKREIGCRSSH